MAPVTWNLLSLLTGTITSMSIHIDPHYWLLGRMRPPITDNFGGAAGVDKQSCTTLTRHKVATLHE